MNLRASDLTKRVSQNIMYSWNMTNCQFEIIKGSLEPQLAQTKLHEAIPGGSGIYVSHGSFIVAQNNNSFSV